MHIFEFKRVNLIRLALFFVSRKGGKAKTCTAVRQHIHISSADDNSRRIDMLKIRLQGTTNDIKWFIKILTRDKRFKVNTPSDPQDIKGTKKYKRVYAEIFRDMDEYQSYNEDPEPKFVSKYYGSGTVFGIKKPTNRKK